MTYWVVHRDTFEGVEFPLYGPIADAADAKQIADAAQQNIRETQDAGPGLMDTVSVWPDWRKRERFGDRPAIYALTEEAER